LFPFLSGNSDKAEIENMGRNDQNNGKREQNKLIIVPILLGEEEKHASREKQKGYRTPVMPGKSVTQGKGANSKSQGDHARFKPEIMYDIHPED
jgi:hypothetical protein